MTSVLDRLAHLEARVTALDRRADVIDFHNVQQQLEKLMADAASILAKITANNDMVKAQTAALVALAEGQADIVSEIAALKAANPAVDFAPLDAAADEQTTLVQGAGKAINANT